MKLVMLRHGESENNVLGLCNADPAVPYALTAKGRSQARVAAEHLSRQPIRHIYVSRLKRAQETAAIVNSRLCADIHVDARLDDRHTGYEGLPVSQYMHEMQNASDPYSWKAGVGESYRDMVNRVHRFLSDLELAEDHVTLVVTHHEVIQAVSGYFRHLSLAEMWQIWVPNCETMEFEK